jgi:hypothetical protein
MRQWMYSYTHSEPHVCSLYSSTISNTNKTAMRLSEVGVILVHLNALLWYVVL